MPHKREGSKPALVRHLFSLREDSAGSDGGGWLAWDLFPAINGFSRIRWYVKSLFRHFLPARESLSQPWWSEKTCFGTFFHRPEVYVKYDGLKKASFPRLLHRRKGFFSPDGQTGQVDSIDQEILSAWMERKARRESWKVEVSILAAFQSHLMPGFTLREGRISME